MHSGQLGPASRNSRAEAVHVDRDCKNPVARCLLEHAPGVRARQCISCKLPGSGEWYPQFAVQHSNERQPLGGFHCIAHATTKKGARVEHPFGVGIDEEGKLGQSHGEI